MVMLKYLLSLFFLLVHIFGQAVSVCAAPAGNNASERNVSLKALSDRGMHYDVMRTYEGMKASDLSLAEKLVVAKSAWALGLVERARSLWDDALATEDFSGQDRLRTMLARAILELQEGHSEESRRIAETAAGKIERSELRAQFWLVIAESLSAQGAQSLAEQYYKRAAEESTKDSKNEALYLLGECQLKLGLINDARYTFVGIGANSSFAPQAIKRLAEIDFQQRDYEGVLTWVDEGRANYAQQFDEPWVHYVSIVSQIELNRISEAETSLRAFRVKYSESDSWFALANAAVEGKLIQRQYPRARFGGNDGVKPSLGAKGL